MPQIGIQGPEKENNRDEDYLFIKETIKKKPFHLGFHVRRICIAVFGGAIFGGAAAVAFAMVLPEAAGQFLQKEDVSLSDARPGPVGTGTPNEKSGNEEYGILNQHGEENRSESGEQSEIQIISSEAMEIYAAVYQDAARIAAEPMKAMVRISGFSGDFDLLDDSFLTYGDEEGVVFLNNRDDLYILTSYQGLEKAETIRVTFSNGAMAEGILCKADPRTGIAVVRVPLNLLTDEEWDEINVAPLSDSYHVDEQNTVIAIGSPSGNYGSVIYGMITSVSGRMNAPDCEYSLLGTNIMGSTESSGVLLDMEGKVTGLVVRTQEDENILKAVSVAELRPLIESLSNGEALRYLGICGSSISAEQSENLEIPEGIYVNSVEAGSPAMVVGIQNGDIITEMNGDKLKDMETYMAELQSQAIGDKAEITVERRDSEENFVEMNFSLIIEEIR